MIDVSLLTDEQKSRLIDNRWNSGADLWSKLENYYKKNKRIWQNNPEWLDNLPPKRSRARDNRVFIAVESVISNLTGRPSKPNVLPAKKTPESGLIASDLQGFFLEKYRTLHMKKKMRRGLRFLFFTRLIVIKIFWNADIDDFDVKPVHPLRVRFNPKANTIEETDYFIEEIEIPVLKLIEKFPEKEEFIVSTQGGSKEDLMVNNPKVVYREAWLGYNVVYQYRNQILRTEAHPYWDWDGIKMLPGESQKLQEKNGKQRRTMMGNIKQYQEFRSKEKAQKKFNYESYLFNHLDRPLPPYMFGSVLEEEDSPTGETDLIAQAESLQLAIDERKRQFSDNADMMNGVFKVDTNVAKISKADAQKAKADPKGIWYGPGVINGVIRETGKELPSFLKDDMIHSTTEVDNLFGSQPTFRGEGGKQETATGRAILREQSFQRMNELVDLVDSLHEQAYNWMLQMVKVKYTKSHFVKSLGANKATEVIDLMQDDLEEGVEVRVIPGQILPEDRLYRAERATEAATAGLIDPLTYFEATEWDDPMKQAKRLVMFKIDPFSVLEMTPEEMAKLQPALDAQARANEAKNGGGAPSGDQQKAQQIAQLRQQAEQLLKSPEFQKMPANQKKEAMQKIKDQLNTLIQSQ